MAAGDEPVLVARRVQEARERLLLLECILPLKGIDDLLHRLIHLVALLIDFICTEKVVDLDRAHGIGTDSGIVGRDPEDVGLVVEHRGEDPRNAVLGILAGKLHFGALIEHAVQDALVVFLLFGRKQGIEQVELRVQAVARNLR